MSGWVTDTHAIIWHLQNRSRLSTRVRAIFDETDQGLHKIYVPAITIVETIYLAERNRIISNGVEQLLALFQSNIDNYKIAPLNRDVAIAVRQIDKATVPEMPDRIIAATGLALNLPVLTRDQNIQKALNVDSIWL